MKILVFGAGAIGSFVGGLFSKDKCNKVILLGRTAHIDCVNTSGLKVTGLEDFVAWPAAINAIGKVVERPDIILVTVKSYDTRNVGVAIKRNFPKGVTVLSLQNGLGNVEILSEILGPENIIAGITSHGVTFRENGWVHHAGTGETVFGEPNRKTTDRIKIISGLFRNAGIKNRITGNITGEIWTKAIVNAGINPLTAITGLENGYILKIPGLTAILEASCCEGIEVARALRIHLPTTDITEKAKKVVRYTAGNRSSMLQDIDKGKRTEIDAMNGAIVMLGRETGIATPVNETLTSIVKAIEATRTSIRHRAK